MFFFFRRGTKKKSLMKYIAKKEWDEVREILQTECGQRQSKKIDFSGMTALSSAVNFLAPMDIIERLLEISPDAASQNDLFGCLPLHIASSCGASQAVVDRLIDIDPFATTTCDEEGNTPLHHAIESVFRSRRSSSCEVSSVVSGNSVSSRTHQPPPSTSSFPDVDVVVTLSFAAPESIMIKNERGLTPFDVTIIRNDKETACQIQRILKHAMVVHRMNDQTTESKKLSLEEIMSNKNRHKSKKASLRKVLKWKS